MPGTTFFDVPAGGSIVYSADKFGQEIGLSEINKFVNVQNTGVVMGHDKVTFSNLG